MSIHRTSFSRTFKHWKTSRLDEHVIFFDGDFQSGSAPIFTENLGIFATNMIPGTYVNKINAVLSYYGQNPFLMKYFLK